MPTTACFELAKIPNGAMEVDDFRLSSRTLGDSGTDLGIDLGIVCESLIFSLDPYLRPLLAGRHLGPRPQPGDLIPGAVVARVLEPGSGFATGDLVIAEPGWKARFRAAPDSLRKLDATIFPEQAPISTALGLFGMAGLTAWAGLRKLARVQAGDTVLISAAAGAVGSSALQIASLCGAQVIGIAGGSKKCEIVSKTFAVPCLDYRAEDFKTQLRAHAPNGVDVYFDNVGGDLLATALSHLAIKARVVLCGLIDQYNANERPAGPNLGPVIAARATLMGLVVYDHYPQRAEFESEMFDWLRAGKLRWLEDISQGFETLPAAFCKLMRGENVGKTLVANNV